LNYDPQKIVVLAEEVASRLDGWNTLSLTIEDGKIDYVAAPNPQAVPLSGEFEVLFIPFTVNPGVSTPIVFTLDNELSGIVSNNDYVVLQDPINSRFTIVQAEPEPEPEVDPIPEAELELEVEPEPEPEVEPVPQAICGDGIVTGDETCVSCPADAGCEGLLECNLLSEQCEEPATDELPLDNPTVEYINSLREIFVSDSSTLSKMSATAGRTICYMNNDCDLGVGQVELSEDEKLEQMLVVFSETLTRNQPRDLTIESIGSIAQDVRCYFDDLCQFAQE
jgi:hypothetical protein